jgi:ABC-2 type transport system permease protein
MAGNSALYPSRVGGWSSGLRNLLRADFGKWFRTRRWLTQALIWVAVIDGILFSVLRTGGGEATLEEGVMLYSVFTGMFPAIAAVVIAQDAIVGERESGTAAWVLSKPVSRPAFVVSKLVPTAVGTLVTMILIPGLIAYGLLSWKAGAPLEVLNFLAASGIFWINLLFYLSLTVMLGTFFTHRGPVIGIPLAFSFGQQLLIGAVPSLVRVLPYTLAVPLSGDGPGSIAAAVLLGQAPPDLLPLLMTLVYIAVFVAVALWRFEREEF